MATTPPSQASVLSHKEDTGDDVLVNPSRAHFHRTYLEVKFLGYGDNGYAFAAVPRREANAIIEKYLHVKSTDCFDEMRSIMVAIKIPKRWTIEGDLKNEIDFLGKIDFLTNGEPHGAGAGGENPCYAHRIDAFVDGGVQWLASPYLSGGDLSRFASAYPHAVTVSFRAHVVFQLARAMLFLTSGITDEDSVRPRNGWLRNTHGYIFVGNVLLRPPHSSGFADFPDVVLADFGRAAIYPTGTPDDEAHDKNSLHDFKLDISQTKDLQKDMAMSYYNSDQVCECRNCYEGRQALGLVMSNALRTHYHGRIAIGLQSLQTNAKVAKRERLSCYHGMPGDALERLRTPKVSNADLETAIDNAMDSSRTL